MIRRRKDIDTANPDIPSLSRKEALILELLVGGRELYGLQLVNASEGALKRGTIYVTLQRLQEKGFIESRQEARAAPEIGIPRRLYRVTGLGHQVLNAYQTALSVFKAAIGAV